MIVTRYASFYARDTPDSNAILLYRKAGVCGLFAGFPSLASPNLFCAIVADIAIYIAASLCPSVVSEKGKVRSGKTKRT